MSEQINPVEILKTLMLEESIDLKTGRLQFSIDYGYVRLSYNVSDKHGSMNYAASHHPTGSCRGKGICIDCGCTLFNDE